MSPELTCRDGVELLMDYTEGLLSETLREVVDAHLAGCKRCVAFVRSYVETPRLVREATEGASLTAEGRAALRRFLEAHRT